MREMICRKFIILCLFPILLHAQKISTGLHYKVKEPASKASKIPVLIFLHGYGSNEEDLFTLANSFDPRFLIFSLRAPTPVNQQGFCWFPLDFLKERQFRYNYAQAAESRNKVISFISNACKAYRADSTQVFLFGFSQGAILSLDIALYAPEKVKGVAALSGYLLKESREFKNEAKARDLHFFLGHGTQDNIVDHKAGSESAAYLKSKKLNVSFKSYAMPHSISAEEIGDINSWLKPLLAK